LGPGLGEVGQGGLSPSLMTSLTKNPHPQPKKFFGVQSTRLAESFEPFTGSVVHTGQEKFLRKAACDPTVFSRIA